jgi:ribonucleoside-triphosphate reductase
MVPVQSGGSGNKMVRLSEKQLEIKRDFIMDYMGNSNAATSSKFDANANVSKKNIATLSAEINKDINIQINRYILREKIAEMFNRELADEYIRQLENHEIYSHDETNLAPYCVSITMYPFLRNGLRDLGGESHYPKHTDSFAGSFVNLVFAVSSQFSGAVATGEWLMCFDYYCRRDYGDNYLDTNTKRVENHLQHMVYALNQPAAARGYQSAFWNISIFDRYYFESLFENFMFPVNTKEDEDLYAQNPGLFKPNWATIDRLQKFFMKWFNKERTRALLTFPVVTAAMLIDPDTKKPRDSEFAGFLAQEMAEGNSFFIYSSDKADSLSSCCRLRNELSDNTFSFTLGAGGIATGSINVISMNMNRFVQDIMRDEKDEKLLHERLKEQVAKIHKYQIAYLKIMEAFLNNGLLTIYEAGFISLKKQFLTLGVNGLVEAAEAWGLRAGNNEDYIGWMSRLLKVIYDENKAGNQLYKVKFNTELVPAENLGVKNSKWDKKGGYYVTRECYNSYFYPVEDMEVNVVDKFILHGDRIVKYLDGGSALHLNLEQYLTKEQYLQLFDIAGKCGTNYWTTNCLVTVCNACSNIDKNKLNECPVCHSVDVDYATRVIGYLKKVSSFSIDRQKEEGKRFYHGKMKS